MLTEQITDVAPQVQTGPGYVVPVQSYVRCRISGQIFAILAAEIVRHVDIAVKHDISSGKLEGQQPVQAHRAGKGGRRKIDLSLGGEGERHAGTKAYMPKEFDLPMRIGHVEGYRNQSH